MPHCGLRRARSTPSRPGIQCSPSSRPRRAKARPPRAAYAQAQAASYAFIYRTQPAVRKVVDYIARNGAQIGVKLYERTAEDERPRQRDHGAAETPAPAERRASPAGALCTACSPTISSMTTPSRSSFARAARTGRLLWRAPVWAVEVVDAGELHPVGYRIHLRDGAIRDVAAADMLHLAGYDPDDPGAGLSNARDPAPDSRRRGDQSSRERRAPEAWRPRAGLPQAPARGARVVEEARERFETDWSNRSKGKRQEGEPHRPRARGGHGVRRVSVSPKDAEMLSRPNLHPGRGRVALRPAGDARRGVRERGGPRRGSHAVLRRLPAAAPATRSPKTSTVQIVEEEYGNDELTSSSTGGEVQGADRGAFQGARLRRRRADPDPQRGAPAREPPRR